MFAFKAIDSCRRKWHCLMISYRNIPRRTNANGSISARSVSRPSARSSNEHERTLPLECVTRRFYNPLSITLLGAPVSFASRHCCRRRRRGKYRNASKRHETSKCRVVPRRTAFVSLSPFLPAYSFSHSQGRDLFDVR